MFAEDTLQKLGVKKTVDGCYELDRRKSENEDPFDIYGHGIIAYFRMMWTMVIVLIVISIMFVPVIIMYHNGGAFENSSTLSQFSMGNLGHAEPHCIHQFIKQKDMASGCGKGTISPIVNSGLMPKYNSSDEF